MAALGRVGGNGPECAVRDYQTAWDESDCELFFQTTTEDYRDETTCADFEEAVASGGLGEYEILDSEIDGDWRIDGHRFEGE